MCITIIRFPVCKVINFEINVKPIATASLLSTGISENLLNKKYRKMH